MEKEAALFVSRFNQYSAHGSSRVGLKWAMRNMLLSALVAVPAFAAGADEVKPLRLCADPTNLPFSSDDPARPGLYLEIGQALGQRLARPVTYTWYKSYFGKRTVRQTLLSKQCDAMIGLPLVDDFMGPAVIFSKAIAREGYALVSAKDRQLTGIGDLKGLRVAVQFQTTPQNLLALHDEIQKVTVLSPDEGMQKLDQGEADVAFVWAPVAGWLNKTAYGDKYRVLPTEGEGLLWPTAIGFAKAGAGLRDEVDAILPSLREEIDRLFVKYGVPSDAPVKFSQGEALRPGIATAMVEPRTVGQATSDKSPSDPADHKADLAAGQELFNGTCGHCHGPNAVQSERKIDLRLLRKRYGDDMEKTYWKTVNDGRPSKGMPAWKEVFNEDQLKSVYVYLQSVQDSGS
jgi:polar amino acid transport system substrate-binding protein